MRRGDMHDLDYDLPHQAARYLEALYEEATAAGRAFRRMGLPRREARLRARAEAEWWGGFASAYARAAVAAYEGSDPRAAFLEGLRTKAAKKELQRLLRELGG
ncbi:hypothetical protein Thermus77412_09370 [Thermus antranikianii]